MSERSATPNTDTAATNFVRDIVEADVKIGKHQGRVATRFPPEPNGYLHIGHAKSICLNFGLAQKFGGTCNLRLDDTNPLAESDEYVRSIVEDVRWLGFDYEDRLFFASDYFPQIYEWAEQLVRDGKAYVDDRGLEEIRSSRGNFYAGGQESPYRNRSIAENLDLLRRMRAGEFGDGERVLRTKIDMSSPNRKFARPGNVPNPPCAPSPHRRHLVPVPNVRLGPWPLRRGRKNYPFGMHVGIRRSPSPLRLVSN